MGSCSPLQGIFPTPIWNPGLPDGRQILYCLSHQYMANVGKGSVSATVATVHKSPWSRWGHFGEKGLLASTEAHLVPSTYCCAIAPGRRAGAPPVWKLTRPFPVQACISISDIVILLSHCQAGKVYILICNHSLFLHTSSTLNLEGENLQGRRGERDFGANPDLKGTQK